MAMDITEEQLRSYLKEEYFFLQNQYEDYDKRSLTIKGWVSAGALAALGLGFQSKSPAAPILPLFTAIIVGVIWSLEAQWKVFQYAIADRIRIIEAYFRNDPEILVKNPFPFQVYHSWYESYAKDRPIFEYERLKYGRPRSLSARKWAAAFRHEYVRQPYATILVICVVSFILLLVSRFPDVFWWFSGVFSSPLR